MLHLTQAFVLINVEKGRVKEVLERLKEVEEVLEVDAVTGAYDIIALVRAPDEEALTRDVLLGKIHNIPGITETSTAIILEV
ncbi:MAG: Lrp/AsnC family transcriptional regulator [Methanobacteriota archaeon]|nr:MAG: Lrp/AsnC family transcriptional regulator [Euryarchaeota archaeon]